MKFSNNFFLISIILCQTFFSFTYGMKTIPQKQEQITANDLYAVIVNTCKLFQKTPFEIQQKYQALFKNEQKNKIYDQIRIADQEIDWIEIDTQKTLEDLQFDDLSNETIFKNTIDLLNDIYCKRNKFLVKILFYNTLRILSTEDNTFKNFTEYHFDENSSTTSPFFILNTIKEFYNDKSFINDSKKFTAFAILRFKLCQSLTQDGFLKWLSTLDKKSKK